MGDVKTYTDRGTTRAPSIARSRSTAPHLADAVLAEEYKARGVDVGELVTPQALQLSQHRRVVGGSPDKRVN